MLRTLFRRSIPALIVGAVILFSFVGRTAGVGTFHLPMRTLGCTYPGVVPSVVSVSPSSGPSAGGTTVTITGLSLDCASAVNFGGVAGTIVSNTATQIVVTSPAHAC